MYEMSIGVHPRNICPENSAKSEEPPAVLGKHEVDDIPSPEEAKSEERQAEQAKLMEEARYKKATDWYRYDGKDISILVVLYFFGFSEYSRMTNVLP
jgi:hypothetical protein